MKRNNVTVSGVAMAFALSAGLAVPALAQENPTGPGSSGSRSAGGAERSGSAVSRGGGETASRGGGAESRGSGSSGGGMSDGSMGTSSSPSMPSSSGFGAAPSRSADRAPRRSDDQGQATRRPAQGQATGRAVPRDSGRASGSSSGGRETASTSSAGRSNDSGSERRAVPVHSRPRDGRSVSGAAIARRDLPPGVGAGSDIFYIYRPYYYPYGFWGSSYGLGLGYLYYDPFWNSGYGYGYPGYGNYGGSSYYGGSGGYSQSYRDTGNLRLRIKPRDAQVFVDGYFVGVVDSFDGVFQRLNLDGGGHKVELKAEGYEPLEFEVLITPGETVTYKGEMKRIQ